LKELEKIRGTVPIAPPAPKAVVLFQAVMDGTGRHLQGEVRDNALYGVPLFGNCFAGMEGGGFVVPAQGEIRFTYFLKTATPLSIRIRVRRDGKTDAHDAVVPDPVAGRPVDARVPFSAFKPMAGIPMPPLVPGDHVPMVYFIGQDPACGMRLDAFVIVELKTDGTVAASKALFAESFDAGPGKFMEGEMADGGMRGTKAYLLPSKGISCWGAFAVPVKETTTLSFRVKPLQDVPQLMIMVWSDKHQENGRLVIDGLKKGEWKEVKFKAAQIRTGVNADGPSIELLTNLKIYQLNSHPDAKALFDDFEIRE
jgi:hypothetical protein